MAMSERAAGNAGAAPPAGQAANVRAGAACARCCRCWGSSGPIGGACWAPPSRSSSPRRPCCCWARACAGWSITGSAPPMAACSTAPSATLSPSSRRWPPPPTAASIWSRGSASASSPICAVAAFDRIARRSARPISRRQDRRGAVAPHHRHHAAADRDRLQRVAMALRNALILVGAPRHAGGDHPPSSPAWCWSWCRWWSCRSCSSAGA